jgi:hypothetical protein
VPEENVESEATEHSDEQVPTGLCGRGSAGVRCGAPRSRAQCVVGCALALDESTKA